MKNIIVKVSKIYSGVKSGVSLFTGEGDDREGVFISFTVVEGEGFFYSGQNEGIAIPGREYNFWFPGLTTGQALFVLQKEVATVNYKPVKKFTEYIVDCSDAVSIHKPYHGRITEINRIGIFKYQSIEECEQDIAFFVKVNTWVTRDLLKPVAVDSYTNPQQISDDHKIINLTQHQATPNQIADGVVETSNKKAVQSALTFDAIPSKSELTERAELLARIASESGCNKAMIGGAPFFMSTLESALLAAGITPLYAFSIRNSVEKHDENCGVIKSNVFKHIGFVDVTE